jgi:hypothetical protein
MTAGGPDTVRAYDIGAMSGAGFALNWTGPDQWRASGSVATRVGAASALLTKPTSARAWLVASKGF